MNFPERYRTRKVTPTLCTLLAFIPLSLGILINPAQSAPETAIISVPDPLHVEAGTQQPLPVTVQDSSGLPRNAMLLISGLPSTSALSAGRLFASGTWALRLSDLDGLKIETTPGAAGQVQVTLSVVTLDGKAIAERTLNVAINPPGGSLAARRERPAPPELPATAPTAALPDPEPVELKPEVRALMTQGDANLAAGKVQVARLFYRRAAEQGWGPGALAMAHTYDPQELARLTVVGGVQPDVKLATKWYEKAKLLGSVEAEAGLRRLSQR